jgi:acetyl-CoA acetyltransferase
MFPVIYDLKSIALETVQDNFAIKSYERAAAAWTSGKFDAEVVPVSIAGRKGD